MNQELDFLKIADIIVTALLGIVGLYLVHSYRRQQLLRVAEKRLAAYQALWSRMQVATPVRLARWKNQPLTSVEREQLFNEFTAWYYEHGNGMFMGNSTRTIYLTAKDNLICDIEYYKPLSIRERLRKLSPKDQEQIRGYLSIRQLSLLRTRMKADLEVFGIPYHNTLNELDKEFLESCGEDISKKPWKKRKGKDNQTDQAIEIFAEETSRG